jgi:hypothetical protein
LKWKTVSDTNINYFIVNQEDTKEEVKDDQERGIIKHNDIQEEADKQDKSVSSLHTEKEETKVTEFEIK